MNGILMFPSLSTRVWVDNSGSPYTCTFSRNPGVSFRFAKSSGTAVRAPVGGEDTCRPGCVSGRVEDPPGEPIGCCCATDSWAVPASKSTGSTPVKRALEGLSIVILKIFPAAAVSVCVIEVDGLGVDAVQDQ